MEGNAKKLKSFMPLKGTSFTRRKEKNMLYYMPNTFDDWHIIRPE